MNRKYCLAIISTVLILAGCVGSKFGSQKKEKVAMKPLPKNDVVYDAFNKLNKQDKPPTLAARTRGSRGVGLADALAGGIVSSGVTAVKAIISNYKSKYNATWQFGLTDLYFYDQPSLYGPFDPSGLQFTGFTLTRDIKIDKHDFAAVKAEFELDTSSLASTQILNDGVFRLKLKNIEVHYAKAKVPANQQFINMDFEITFTTTYVSKEGQFYADVPLGKFLYPIRRAPLDSTNNPVKFKHFYDSLKNTPLSGKSFIVPRSYGYYKTLDSVNRAYTLTPYWNQGNFSIAAKVTESSKNNFVEEMLINSSGIVIDYESGVIMNRINSVAKPKK